MSEITPNNIVEVIIVGCGTPDRGMGWYHAIQLIEKRCPSAFLAYIVEPWFLSTPGATSLGSEEFNLFKSETETTHGVSFLQSLSQIPVKRSQAADRLIIISGRTSSNPEYFMDAIKIDGCKCIYLEKPGAPSVSELVQMKEAAQEAGIEVFMGYNKNICKYVNNTREFAATVPGSTLTFASNNDYENNPTSLGECFERNSEGMLKNMMIHELALLVSFFDVRVDSIEDVMIDNEFTDIQTLKGPSSGKIFRDFVKAKFSIKTKSGNVVTLQGDRCGGCDAYALVLKDDGKEVFRGTNIDKDDEKHIHTLTEKHPKAMSYFLTQDLDYVELKERIAKHILIGSPVTDVATITAAVETLKVAEYLTPLLLG